MGTNHKPQTTNHKQQTSENTKANTHTVSAGGSWKDLFRAAEENDIPKAKYHLDRGVDPNFQHPEYFTSPLFEAIRGGHLDFVKLLIEEGRADPSVVEELTDDSALEVAIASREFGIRDY